MKREIYFSTSQLQEFCGLSNPTLTDWAKRGWIRSAVGGGTQGTQRYWARTDLIGVRVAQCLRLGSTVPDAEAIAALIEEHDNGPDTDKAATVVFRCPTGERVTGSAGDWFSELSATAEDISPMLVVPLGLLIRSTDELLEKAEHDEKHRLVKVVYPPNTEPIKGWD